MGGCEPRTTRGSGRLSCRYGKKGGGGRRGNRLMTTPLSPVFFCGGRRRPFVSRTAVGVWFSTNFGIASQVSGTKNRDAHLGKSILDSGQTWSENIIPSLPLCLGLHPLAAPDFAPGVVELRSVVFCCVTRGEWAEGVQNKVGGRRKEVGRWETREGAALLALGAEIECSVKHRSYNTDRTTWHHKRCGCKVEKNKSS